MIEVTHRILSLLILTLLLGCRNGSRLNTTLPEIPQLNPDSDTRTVIFNHDLVLGVPTQCQVDGRGFVHHYHFTVPSGARIIRAQVSWEGITSVDYSATLYERSDLDRVLIQRKDENGQQGEPGLEIRYGVGPLGTKYTLEISDFNNDDLDPRHFCELTVTVLDDPDTTESNNTVPAVALSGSSAYTVTAYLASMEDEDYFRFRLPANTITDIELEYLGAPAKVQPSFTAFQYDGVNQSYVDARVGESLPKRGRYWLGNDGTSTIDLLIRVSDFHQSGLYNNEFDNETPYQLRITFDPLPAEEPENNSCLTTTQSGFPTTSKIDYVGDTDCYAVSTATPRRLNLSAASVSSQSPIDLCFKVYKDNGGPPEHLIRANCIADKPLTLFLPGGDYQSQGGFRKLLYGDSSTPELFYIDVFDRTNKNYDDVGSYSFNFSLEATPDRDSEILAPTSQYDVENESTFSGFPGAAEVSARAHDQVLANTIGAQVSVSGYLTHEFDWDIIKFQVPVTRTDLEADATRCITLSGTTYSGSVMDIRFAVFDSEFRHRNVVFQGSDAITFSTFSGGTSPDGEPFPRDLDQDGDGDLEPHVFRYRSVGGYGDCTAYGGGTECATIYVLVWDNYHKLKTFGSGGYSNFEAQLMAISPNHLHQWSDEFDLNQPYTISVGLTDSVVSGTAASAPAYDPRIYCRYDIRSWSWSPN